MLLVSIFGGLRVRKLFFMVIGRVVSLLMGLFVRSVEFDLVF